MKHFIHTHSWSKQEIDQIIDLAQHLKQHPLQSNLQNKTIALLFFNPSLRTRTSFEVGINQLGGTAVVLQPGKDAWSIEFNDGTVMDGTPEEHIKEVAKVLSTYVDAIAVRAFPEFQDWSLDRQDMVINSFVKYASVPIINMETIVHPCQELALMMTLKNHIPKPEKKKFVLTWTWHPKPLNMAVANSALCIASKFAMNVTLLCPSQAYLLDKRYLDIAQHNCAMNKTKLSITHDIEAAYSDADFVYAKSWGSLKHYGKPAQEYAEKNGYKNFIVNSKKMQMTNNAKFSHCLPLRRNVKATDAVMDSKNCVAIEEAENRLHTQKALLTQLFDGGEKS